MEKEIIYTESSTLKDESILVMFFRNGYGVHISHKNGGSYNVIAMLGTPMWSEILGAAGEAVTMQKAFAIARKIAVKKTPLTQYQWN